MTWDTIYVAYRKPFPGVGCTPELLMAFGDRSEALAWAEVEHNALSEDEGARWEYGVAKLAGEALRKFYATREQVTA